MRESAALKKSQDRAEGERMKLFCDILKYPFDSVRHAAYAVNEDDAGARAVRMSEAKEHKRFFGTGRRGIDIIYVKPRVVNCGEEI